MSCYLSDTLPKTTVSILGRASTINFIGTPKPAYQMAENRKANPDLLVYTLPNEVFALEHT